MRQILLFIMLVTAHFSLAAQQIDESFSSAPSGWELNGVNTLVTSNYLQISKLSENGFVISPAVVAPSNITIHTINSGTSNRSIKMFYETEDAWVEFFQYTVTQNSETVNVPVTELATIEGPFRLRIVNTGSNPYRINRFIVGDPATPSSEADIISFSLPGQMGDAEIDADAATIKVTVPTGTNVGAVTPEFSLSAGASASPGFGDVINLTVPVQYEVTAQDGTAKTWSVEVTFKDSDEKEITSFTLSSSQIGNSVIHRGNGLIKVNMPHGSDLSAVMPSQITISPSATIAPAVNTARDFSTDVQYEVTAQDGTKKTWTIQVTLVDPALAAVDFSTPVGFAAIDGDGFTGPTTGGGNIKTSTNILIVNGNDDFEELVRHLYDRIRAYRNKADFGRAKYAPLVVIMEEGVYTGTGSLSGTGSVWSPSTGMFSIEEQADLTIIGRGDAVLKFGFNVKRSWNIIFRNLTFFDYYDDGINIGGTETHHVWVDHCTFGHPTTMPANKDHPDGGVDVKDGASYVTVSWCVFRNSWKTGLVGHSDSNESTDTGRLKTTFYMNHYVNTNSRHPRVRFGEVHVLNNFYEGVLNYGIAAAFKANVVAEGNFFLNTVWPMYADRVSADFKAVYGNWVSQTGYKAATALLQFNNLYDDSGLTRVYTSSNINTNMLNPGHKSIKFDELNPHLAFEPLVYYTYTPVDAALVPELVRTYAGATKVDFFADDTPSSVKPETNGPELSLLPNPVRERLTIRSSANGMLTISDLSGRHLFSRTILSGATTITTAEMNLKPGIYLVTVGTTTGQTTTKLIVQ